MRHFEHLKRPLSEKSSVRRISIYEASHPFPVMDLGGEMYNRILEITAQSPLRDLALCLERQKVLKSTMSIA